MNRILNIYSLEDAKLELAKINVSSQGVEVMASKAIGLSIKLIQVNLGAANILKQEMLSIGGDAAVARGVVNGKLEFSDIILLGNLDKIKKLVKKLNYQTIFGLPEIKQDLINIIDNLENPQGNAQKFTPNGYARHGYLSDGERIYLPQTLCRRYAQDGILGSGA